MCEQVTRVSHTCLGMIGVDHSGCQRLCFLLSSSSKLSLVKCNRYISVHTNQASGGSILARLGISAPASWSLDADSCFLKAPAAAAHTLIHTTLGANECALLCSALRSPALVCLSSCLSSAIRWETRRDRANRLGRHISGQFLKLSLKTAAGRFHASNTFLLPCLVTWQVANN